MRRLSAVPILLALLMSTMFAQTQVPRINRDIERFERSVRQHRHYDTEDLTDRAHEARKAAYKLVIVAEETVSIWEESGGSDSLGDLDLAARGGRIGERMRTAAELVRPIRDISFLDPNRNRDAVPLDRPREWPDLTSSLHFLRELSLSIRTRMDSFYGLTGVTLADLEGFSLKAMIDAVEKLAASVSEVSSRPIEKASANRR
jgi:hypothetical protein